MMSARDRHLASKLRLEFLIAQLLRKLGGTGCDLTVEQYIAQQLKEWSNTRDRLILAIACFEDLKKNMPPPRKDTYGKMDRKAHANAQQEAPQSPNARDGFLVCGINPPR